MTYDLASRIIKLLIIEYSPINFDLFESESRRAGIKCLSKQIDYKESLVHALEEFKPDVILAEYNHLLLDVISVLKIVQKDYPEIPVIILTDDLVDTHFVDLIQAGAKELVLKSQLTKLPLAILYELTLKEGKQKNKHYQIILKDSLDDLAEAQRLAHIGSWSWDLSSDILRWSTEYYKIHNQDIGLLTLNYIAHLKVYTPESAKRLDTAIKKVLDQGEPYELELELIKSDTVRRWILARGAAKFDENSKIVGLYGTAQDITEHKMAEINRLKLIRANTLLSSCNRVLIYSDSEYVLLFDICRLAVEVGNYLMAWVGFPENDEVKSVKVVAESGFEEGYLENIKVSWADNDLGRGPTGLALRTGNIQVNQNCITNLSMAPWREAALRRGYHASIALPLIAEDSIIGVLTIYASEEDAFNPEETKLLSELAENLAFGIHALRIREERNHAIIESQQYAGRLSNALEETLKAIAATFEMRDPYTAGHQRRVAELAEAIGKKMGLPAGQVQGIHLAALVHDLGKIRVPAEILSRPGKLGEAAFALVKTHPQVGYEILKGIEFPWPIAETVLQHHERLNGSGYPKGLKDEEILLEAKIIAVADTFESMVSHRPYRPGLGKEAALDEIKKNSGILYAPSVVEACIKLLVENDFEFNVNGIQN